MVKVGRGKQFLLQHFNDMKAVGLVLINNWLECIYERSVHEIYSRRSVYLVLIQCGKLVFSLFNQIKTDGREF